MNVAAKILCVDDDELVLMAVEELLKTEGYDLVTASGGAQALEILDSTEVDLMIFDVIMPGMNGYELCEKVRTYERFADTPIIMLTAMSSEKDKKRGMEAGATVYLPKPISPSKLCSLVASIVQSS
jgi:DNA-binding response OmpR family regulator